MKTTTNKTTPLGKLQEKLMIKPSSPIGALQDSVEVASMLMHCAMADAQVH